MRRTGFFMSESCFWHTTGEAALTAPVGGWIQPMAAGGHAESPESKRRLVSLLNRSGTMKHLDQRDAELATSAEIEQIHTSKYLTTFKEMSDHNGGILGSSAPFGRGSYEIALESAGLARDAVKTVLTGDLDTAYALTRPPGHHCLRNQSMGFCLLSNIGIAIEAARKAKLVKRVFVLDWDVHHGNGTQSIFYDDPDIFTCSLHQANMFPTGYTGLDDRGAGAGAGTNLNLPLPAGCGETAYIYAMEHVVMPAIQAFEPELIIIACGLDANHVDPLARMSCVSSTFATMTDMVMDVAGQLCDGRVVAVHEGGYSEPYVPFCAHRVVESLADFKSDLSDPFLPKFLEQQPETSQVQWQIAEIDRMAKLLN